MNLKSLQYHHVTEITLHRISINALHFTHTNDGINLGGGKHIHQTKENKKRMNNSRGSSQLRERGREGSLLSNLYKDFFYYSRRRRHHFSFNFWSGYSQTVGLSQPKEQCKKLADLILNNLNQLCLGLNKRLNHKTYH
jgi:hypothetical protein